MIVPVLQGMIIPLLHGLTIPQYQHQHQRDPRAGTEVRSGGWRQEEGEEYRTKEREGEEKDRQREQAGVGQEQCTTLPLLLPTTTARC